MEEVLPEVLADKRQAAEITIAKAEIFKITIVFDIQSDQTQQKRAMP